KLIVKTMREVFRDLCAERHRRFLAETEAKFKKELYRLSRSNPLAYKQLRAFARHSPGIDIQALRNLKNPIPAAFREQLEFLNEQRLRPKRRPQGHTYGLPTKQEVREETIRRMKKRCKGWEPAETRHWWKLFKAAKLAGLEPGKAGRPKGN